jgi:hypothetical protein
MDIKKPVGRASNQVSLAYSAVDIRGRCGDSEKRWEEFQDLHGLIREGE